MQRAAFLLPDSGAHEAGVIASAGYFTPFHLGRSPRLHSVLSVLTDKPWRLEAIVRLLVAMLACLFLGSLALAVLRHHPATATVTQPAFFAMAGSAAVCLLASLATVARPWPLESFKWRVTGLLLCLYAGLALTALVQQGNGHTARETTVVGMLAAVLSFQGAAIPLVWLFVRQHSLSLRESFGFANNPKHAALLGMTAAMAFMPVGLGLNSGLAMLARHFDIHLPEQDAVFILRLADSLTDRIALGVVAVVIAPLAEEVLFRGILYPAIKGFGHPRLALWSTSLVFAMIHFNALSFIPLVVLAIVLVKLYEKTGNLLACIACHAAFNTFNFVMLFLFNDLNPALPASQ
jgi:membrane protease YdiL (CAAX protease family)